MVSENVQAVDKELCDERSGHLDEAVKDIKKSIDKITWLIITTLIAVCSNLLLKLDSPCSQVAAAIKQWVS